MTYVKKLCYISLNFDYSYGFLDPKISDICNIYKTTSTLYSSKDKYDFSDPSRIRLTGENRVHTHSYKHACIMHGRVNFSNRGRGVEIWSR